MPHKWAIVLGLALAILASLGQATAAESINVLQNGSFEDEFVNGVGKSWTAFNNGGLASYVYYDDTWDRVTYDGKHSQALTVHTKAVGGSERDRYAGIYQTVDVVAGKRYMFSLYGMVRSTEGNEKKSGYNYRVQVGFDHQGGTDPWVVTDWWQMEWPEYARAEPGRIQSYAHGITPTSGKLTVFIRVWKKFPTVGQQADINLDAISLLGPNPGTASGGAASDSAAGQGSQSSRTIPQTGAGSLLPIAGLALGAVAIGLRTRRLLKRRPS